MKAHHDSYPWWKRHFEWIAQSRANRAKNGRFHKLCLISQKLPDNFSCNRTKWKPIMTPFSSENPILIESPEVGQIGQNRAKNGRFHKLCLISQKLSDNFSCNRTRWRPIMTPISCENAILIESPKVGANWAKLGQKWAISQTLPNFSKTVW